MLLNFINLIMIINIRGFSMKSSPITQICHSSSTLTLAAKKHLDYFNPKGASKRILPYNLHPSMIQIPKKPSESPSPSPTKLPPLKSKSRSHLALVKSTRTLKNLNFISSRDASPTKLDTTIDSVGQLSGIMESCEQISKINKSDIIIAAHLRKHNKETYDKTDQFIKNQLPVSFINAKGRVNYHKPSQGSIDKFKKESFETAYFVEKTLNKNNSIKRLKEKIMPWKKINFK